MNILDLPVTMGPEGSPAQPTLRSMVAAHYAATITDPVIAHAAAAEYCRQFEIAADAADPLKVLLGRLGGGKDGVDVNGVIDGVRKFSDMFAGAGFGQTAR